MKTSKLYWSYAASICLLLFAVIAYFVVSNEAILKAIDQPIQQLIRGTLTPEKTIFFKYFTKFGNTVTIALLFIVSFGVLFFKLKDKIAAYWLAINTVLLSGIGNLSLKYLFNRPRPSVEHLVVAKHSSFPSGHAMGSMLFYGTLIFLAYKYIDNKTMRLVIQIALGIIILLIGASRIYLGVHYPTDILGGYLLGACWLTFSYPYFKKYDFIQRFEGTR